MWDFVFVQKIVEKLVVGLSKKLFLSTGNE